ncbi:MAG: hypothetical protein QOJ14_326, partial [Thermoleophilaceae bacterium]|nr:hypothetical protein [Thermoleophilaceae bacterium]
VAAIISRTTVMADGCDVGPWRTIQAVRAAAAGGQRSFDVDTDDAALAVAVDGDGDAPKVTLKGPGGRTVEAPDSGALRTDTAIAARAPSQDVTYFVLAKPEKGTWTVEERPGSAGVKRVREAHTRPDPNVQGDLGTQAARSSSATKVLRYSLHKLAGQKVTFREIGKHVDHVIGTTKAASGRIRFTPAPGPSGKRRIVAFIEQNGLPRDQVAVATFRYRPVKPKRPRHLRVKRKGHKLVVTFGRVRGADLYNVSVQLSDGRKRFFLVRGRPRPVKLGNLAARTRGTVLVSAQHRGERRGPVARAKLKAKRHRH